MNKNIQYVTIYTTSEGLKTFFTPFATKETLPEFEKRFITKYPPAPKTPEKIFYVTEETIVTLTLTDECKKFIFKPGDTFQFHPEKSQNKFFTYRKRNFLTRPFFVIWNLVNEMII